MKKIVCCVLLVSLILCGCNTKVPTYEYSHESPLLTEPCGHSLLFVHGVDVVTVEGIRYQFSFEIEETERARFIEEQKKLTSFLAEQISLEGLTVSVLPQYPCRSDSETKTAYIGMNFTGSWNHILAVLQSLWGDYTNYGYLYALSNKIAEQLDWTADTRDEVDLKSFCATPGNLNLEYPCFSLQFSNSRDIAAAKHLSCLLLEQMEDPYEGEKAFRTCIADYAAQNGIDFQGTYLRFAYNGESCPVKIKTKYLEISLDESYQNGMYYEYGYIKKDQFANITEMTREIQRLDDYLGEICLNFDFSADILLPTFLTNNTLQSGRGWEASGLYYMDIAHQQPHIEALGISVIPHEYIHYIVDMLEDESDTTAESWHSEVLTHYYSRGEIYQQMYLDEMKESGNISYYSTLLGEPFDEVNDVIVLHHIFVAVGDQPPQYYLKSHVYGELSFAGFFVEHYGEEALRQSMLAPAKTASYTGKNLETIVLDWAEYINTEFDHFYIKQD